MGKAYYKYYGIINGNKYEYENFYNAYTCVTEHIEFYYKDEIEMIERDFADDIDKLLKMLEEIYTRMSEDKIFIMQEENNYIGDSKKIRLWQLERKIEGHYEIIDII